LPLWSSLGKRNGLVIEGGLARETMFAAMGHGEAGVRAACGGFDLARGVLLRSRYRPLRNTRRVQGMGYPLNRRQG
jgi:hypothetical protein